MRCRCCCRCPNDLSTEILSDLQRDVFQLKLSLRELDKTIKKGFIDMAEREDVAWAKQAEDIQAVKDGWAVLVAGNAAKDQRIADLEAALAAAGADQEVAVAAALDADSEADAAKVEAANAALESLAAPAPEPTPEP